MNKRLVFTMAIFVVLFSLTPSIASAEMILVSEPLPAGDGGNVCACTNLKESAFFDFIIANNFGSMGCSNQDIGIGSVGRCVTSWAGPLNCKVKRVDGKSISSKKVKCTFSALDANGNPTDHVPVDTRINWPY